MAYILEGDQLTKYYGSTLIFQQVRIMLEAGEKAGLVGMNGAGKTTLLNCLMGKEELEGGWVRLAPYATVGYLEQQPEVGEEDTLLSSVLAVFNDVFAQRHALAEMEAAMAYLDGPELEEMINAYGNLRERYERAGGFACEAKVRRILSGLGFQESQLEQPFASFSGGEKTRIGLARILVRDYEMLFLDEPTNHLDLAAVEWLESFLATYPGALLIISHDRFFLDKIITTTFDLAEGHLKRYKGNYSVYIRQKEEEEKAQWRAYEKQQKEIQETEAYIRRFKAGIKSKQARGRESRLNRLERLEKPGHFQAMHMGQPDILSRTGEKVLVLERLTYSYPGKPLFTDLNAEIRYGERVALLGPNGVGKTTLLRLIMGQQKPGRGNVTLGARVKPAYFDQEHQNLTAHNTVLQEILEQFDLTVEEAKSQLARFLFGAEEWDQEIRQLSGGEQGRLSLLKLTLTQGNFLILDEPTNHLDIGSREVMEEYLRQYPGTILMVSHDRYFLDRLAQRILVLAPDGLTSYPGNYSAYQERKEREERSVATLKNRSDNRRQDSQNTSLPTGPRVVEKGPGQRGQPLDRYAKARLRQQIQDLEREIAALEETEAVITAALSNPSTYTADQGQNTLKELNTQLQMIQNRLPQAYEEWEEAGQQLEQG